MSQKANVLPYFKIKQKPKEKLVADFLLRKFKTKIKEKYAQTPKRNQRFLTGQGKRHIFRKKTKNKAKTGKERKSFLSKELSEKRHFYEQKQILNELKKLTSLVKKLEKKISRIEKKLDLTDN